MGKQPGRMLWVWLLAACLAALARLHAAGVPQWFHYNTVEAAANVLLFVPVGFVATVGFCGSWRQTEALGAFTSACVELGQLMFLQNRYPSLIDVATNTGSAMLGFLLARRFLSRRNHADAS